MLQLRRGRFFAVLAASSLLLTGCGEHYLVLNTAGPVASMEKGLIILSTVLALIIVIPVIGLLWYIVRRFRDTPDNTAPYKPEWSESKTLEIIWWSIPIVIVGILGSFTAKDTFALTRPPDEKPAGTPLTIEVTSLDWKWLFQYPDQNVATVNYCEIPINRPVEFVLTSNAPMNSFWVPQLGGQEYTMPGMAMRLWLEADKVGTYFGHGANFSGRGYSHMNFDVRATTQSGFDSWVANVKRSAPPLTEQGYQALVSPGVLQKTEFSSFPPHIFWDTIMKEGGQYMQHDKVIMETTK